MKRLVLLGEGHGEVSALPVLVDKLLQEKKASDVLYLDRDVIRTNPNRLVKWNKAKKQPDFSEWVARVTLAARRREVGGVLAVYDGDERRFPAGSANDFCAATAAKMMAAAATQAGAGRKFSLCIVFACSEYETWLVAGAESFTGRALRDGRIILPAHVKLPSGDHELRGKGWLEQNCVSYRPTRDQSALTELLDFQFVRARKLRSFARLEHTIDQLLEAVAKDRHISTPA
jgi:hypothetical protein